MNGLPLRLLRDRDAFWDALRSRALGWRDLAQLALFVVTACTVYGVVLAGWRSPLLAAYVAVKLPLLFLATMALVAVSNWMLATLMGAGLGLRDTLFLVFGAMTVSGWMLLGLAPVALLFLLTGVPETGTDDVLRTAHNAMLLTHIGVLAASGLAGNAVLFGGLRRSVRPHCAVHVLFALWVLCFAFVGCQMAWILRPFVGSPFYPVAFLRPDAMDRNFYEFVFGEVLPFLVLGQR